MKELEIHLGGLPKLPWLTGALNGPPLAPGGPDARPAHYDAIAPYRFTARAKADLRSIWSYIAADSVGAADRVEIAIYAACTFLAESPLGGPIRQDLTRLPVRFWTLVRYPNYVPVTPGGSKVCPVTGKTVRLVKVI